MTKGEYDHDLSQMRNEDGQLALPRVRLPRDAVSEEEKQNKRFD